MYNRQRHKSEIHLATSLNRPALAHSQLAVLQHSTMAPAATSTCQDVTIPVIPELYDPNFLDVLLPKDDAPPVPAKVQEPSHPMIDALKASVNRTRTTNNDPAYASTLSATLDAFQALKPHYFDTKLHHILADAWAEDPALTLRIIWNSRSIHDGKGDRNIFYQ